LKDATVQALTATKGSWLNLVRIHVSRLTRQGLIALVHRQWMHRLQTFTYITSIPTWLGWCQ